MAGADSSAGRIEGAYRSFEVASVAVEAGNQSVVGRSHLRIGKFDLVGRTLWVVAALVEIVVAVGPFVAFDY